MRVYQVNTFFGAGGAAIAAMRLNQGLTQAGVDSQFVSPHVPETQATEGMIPVCSRGSVRERIWRRWRRAQLERLSHRHQSHSSSFSPFSYDLSCSGMALLEACRGADVLNFHWMVDLLDYPYVLPRLNSAVPLVWTLHDMNLATGGCYYTLDCQAFHTMCGSCPVLGSNKKRDLSSEIWERKAKALSRLRAPLSLVTPSEWLAGEMRKSSLLGQFPVQCIPNSLDTDVFRPRNRAQEKQKRGLDPNRPVILFVAAALDNPWKGLGHLVEALPLIQAKHAEVQFLAVGDVKAQHDWPVPVHVTSANEEDAMARVYASADLLVVPSVADNFPNVIIEAMACGVSAVGFRVGGIPEAIGQNGETGRLAPEQNANELAKTVCCLLKQVMNDRIGWEQRCRSRAVREFDLKVQAGRYATLYQSLVEEGSSVN